LVQYVVRRLLLFVPVWLGVVVLTFFMMHMVPGNPVIAEFNGRPMTKAAIHMAEVQLGLTEPLWTQLGTFIWNAARGNLGMSWESHVPVMQLILQRMPYTLSLALWGLLFGAVGGVILGVIAAVTRGSKLDQTLLVLSLIMFSFPGFWLAEMLIWLMAVDLHLLPVAGATGFASLLMPSFVLATGAAPSFLRLTRASMLEILRSDYVRTARAKGVWEWPVRLRHALRNALIPIVTVVALSFGSLLGGAFIIEQVFSRPGLGTLIVDAILARDLPLIQGVILYTATVFLLVNLAVDILYAYLDPRIQYR
jgi:peptide/nickel transport system permease protein